MINFVNTKFNQTILDIFKLYGDFGIYIDQDYKKLVNPNCVNNLLDFLAVTRKFGIDRNHLERIYDIGKNYELRSPELFIAYATQMFRLDYLDKQKFPNMRYTELANDDAHSQKKSIGAVIKNGIMINNINNAFLYFISGLDASTIEIIKDGTYNDNLGLSHLLEGLYLSQEDLEYLSNLYLRFRKNGLNSKIINNKMNTAVLAAIIINRYDIKLISDVESKTIGKEFIHVRRRQ